MLSISHIILVLVIVLVLFGAGRLPGVMGDLGRGFRNFKAGLSGEDEAPQAQRRPTEIEHKPADTASAPAPSRDTTKES